jgi:hypothetical protein
MKSEVKKKMSVASCEVVVPKSRRENFQGKSQLENLRCCPVPAEIVVRTLECDAAARANPTMNPANFSRQPVA